MESNPTGMDKEHLLGDVDVLVSVPINRSGFLLRLQFLISSRHRPLWCVFSLCTKASRTLINLLQCDMNTVKSLSELFSFSLRGRTWQGSQFMSMAALWNAAVSLSLSLNTLRLVSVVSADTARQLCVSGIVGINNVVEVSVGSSFCTQTHKTTSYCWNFAPERLFRCPQWDDKCFS